ncbi:MAG: hypothetical protein DDT31_01930 [Syntrophomonadaceae bacterium]|nr:hypothetical protein [Bacillota bacterium]
METLYDQYIGKRVVLKTCHHVSFAGKVVEQIGANQREGLIVELDPDSGFSIFCPISAINEIIQVPIPD